jgi:hypothetical protein
MASFSDVKAKEVVRDVENFKVRSYIIFSFIPYFLDEWNNDN